MIPKGYCIIEPRKRGTCLTLPGDRPRSNNAIFSLNSLLFFLSNNRSRQNKSWSLIFVELDAVSSSFTIMKHESIFFCLFIYPVVCQSSLYQPVCLPDSLSLLLLMCLTMFLCDCVYNIMGQSLSFYIPTYLLYLQYFPAVRITS